MNKRWDIFCHVVDNYGDAGVCWRLARQLAHEFDVKVCLWIDDLSVLQKLHPEIDSNCAQQVSAGVTVRCWTQPLPSSVKPADVVIEAFACELPETYLAAMRAHQSLCINLEYLSAEPWVVDCHGLPSPQGNGALKKFFFFPGFCAGTGGVLGERDLSQKRRAFQRDECIRKDFFARFNITVPAQATCISLFAYRTAPIEALLQVWAAQSTPIVCFVPEGEPCAAVAKLMAANAATTGALTIVVLPFLSQEDYDRLLWSCDINFVRGEDSFVRAQWAGRPCVWQIYAQSERAHWPKLDAFLALYGEYLSASHTRVLRSYWYAWNGAGDIGATWRDYADALPVLRDAAERWAQRLETGTNLAAALVQFCANRV